jgi:hypothetical protein
MKRVCLGNAYHFAPEALSVILSQMFAFVGQALISEITG